MPKNRRLEKLTSSRVIAELVRTKGIKSAQKAGAIGNVSKLIIDKIKRN